MEPAQSLRAARVAAGLTQADLAARAGVSRALVSAVESGRHLPRVDAALALARALATTADRLFGSGPPCAAPIDALTGEPPAVGARVRLGFVGERAVTTPVHHGLEGWEAVDDVIGAAGAIEAAPHAAARRPLVGQTGIASDARPPTSPQLVVAGCEPGLRLLERMLRSRGTTALAITASSTAALAALAADRLHGAVVHFTAAAGPPEHARGAFVRVRLAGWRVGLAAPRGRRRDWWRAALAGRTPVVQRERGAAAQSAFEQALTAKRRAVPGPRVPSHLAASHASLAFDLPAVTIEPAAAAVGADFHPLETHVVELWLSAARAAEPGVVGLMEALHSPLFRRTLESVGAYDLSELGRRVA